MPAVSVIIPCYNSEAFVARAIESVLRQSFQDFELILVDNNSTDNTLAILNQYAEAHPKTIKVLQEPKPGAPFARNRGLAEATSEWLQFLDSDDELLADKLKCQFELTKHSDPDLVVGNFIVWRAGVDGEERKVVSLKAENPWKSLIESRLGKTSGLLWRKDAVVAAGGWNENLTSSQEYDLLFRLLQDNIKIEYSDSADTIHYIRNNSISHSDSNARTVEILNNYINLRLAIREYLLTRGEYTRDLRQAVVTSLYFKLLPYKKRLPAYWKAKQVELHLKLPLQFRIRREAMKTKKRLWDFMKKRLVKSSKDK